jgi:hypothetical protein
MKREKTAHVGYSWIVGEGVGADVDGVGFRVRVAVGVCGVTIGVCVGVGVVIGVVVGVGDGEDEKVGIRVGD